MSKLSVEHEQLLSFRIKSALSRVVQGIILKD